MKTSRRWLCICLIGLLFCACSRQLQKAPASSHPEPSESSSSESQKADLNFPVTIGETVLSEKPERVVSLNPSITEILCDMGLQAALAGIGEFDSPPSLSEEKPRCGSETAPDIPAVLQAGAQAVLSVSPLPERAQRQLEEADIPLVRLDKPERVEELPFYYEQIAKALLGEEEGATAAAAFYEPLMARFHLLLLAADELSEHPLGAFAAFLPLTLATSDCLQGRLLEQCGISNAAAEYSEWQYPQELLIPFEPEVLVVDTRTVTPEEVSAHPNYRTTPCAVNGRILGIDGSAIENCGQRLFEAAEEMALLAGAVLPD
ncbi:MAG: ABC transporter substrate-binding protein [Provencibacterium sp.]|nr:ABC transporter substrate-binding protein [Provencibacterium sp.]